MLASFPYFIFTVKILFMISVGAICDGTTLKVLDNVEISSPRQVIVTFLDEDDLAGFTMNRIAVEGGRLTSWQKKKRIYK
jgi:hypothetical protein